MEHPAIYQTLKTGYPEIEEVIDRCTYCKDDIIKGQSVIMDFDYEAFCDTECAVNQMLKDGTFKRQVAGGGI